MYGRGILNGLKITLKHLFEREITVQYPEQMPNLHNRFRGCLQLEFEKCIACGICAKSCPNDVLSMETAKDEGSKKKKLTSFTIDMQYCMFCNLCVEACPANGLYFNKDFELSKDTREATKVVYTRPAHMDENTEAEVAAVSEEKESTDDDKKAKQVQAMIGAMQKDPKKVVKRIVENEEDAEILAEILQADEKKLLKIAELMVLDKEKAQKIADAFVKKERDTANKEGGN